VSKRLSAPYRPGPSRDWIKVKNPDSPAMIRAREAKAPAAEGSERLGGIRARWR
jgi:ATP-dependent DNA ligase